jgi:putative ABC transport system permease protein
MLLFSFTFRHLRRHWRLNLVVLLGLVLAAALLSALPGYAQVISARSLHYSLETASPATRNLRVSATSGAMGARIFGDIKDALGKVIKSRVEVRQASLAADPPPPTPQVDGLGRIVQNFPLWSYDRLSHGVRVVKGQLPAVADSHDIDNPLKPPPMEVVIGVETAADTGLKVGDRLTAVQQRYRLDIVGIVEPLDPGDDMWGGDLAAFDVQEDSSNPNYTLLDVPLILAPKSIQDFAPSHQAYWRVVVDREQITLDNAQEVLGKLVNIQTQSGANRVQISTGLVQILDDYLAQLSKVRVSLFLLTSQAFVFVLYTLAMLTSFLLDRSQAELVVLAGRGATTLQIVSMFAVESLALALPAALLLGPYAGHGAIVLWARLVDAPVIPATVSHEARLLALVATGLGWLALVLPVYPAARRSVLEWQRERARPQRLARWQKLYLDLFLLALGLLAYWQLSQSGSFVMSRVSDRSVTDPILLLGPSLLLVAVALIFLRIFPFLLRLVAWGLRRARGLMLPVGLSRLARDPVKPSRVVLLISLAAGLAFFASAFEHSLTQNQREMGHYLAGADLRVSLEDDSIESLRDLPGVQAASLVYRGLSQNEEGQGVQLFAVDPATFNQVARYFVSVSSLKMTTIVNVLERPTQDQAVPPVIMSYSAMPTQKVAGDELVLSIAGYRPHFQVQGLIGNFPTLNGAFAIVSLPELAEQADMNSYGVRRVGEFEGWLTVDPAQHEALVNHPLLEGHVLGDAQAEYRSFQSDVLAQGTSGAFELNTLTLAVLSVVGFMLVHYFAAQQRRIEFSVLRSMGLSTRQLLSLLTTEGLLVIGMGLLAGTLIGYGLSDVMVPYLSRAISDSLGGVTIPRALVNWLDVARLYGALIGFYALAILFLQLALMRGGIHRALRIGDE